MHESNLYLQGHILFQEFSTVALGLPRGPQSATSVETNTFLFLHRYFKPTFKGPRSSNVTIKGGHDSQKAENHSF